MVKNKLQNIDISQFQQDLLQWYYKEKRDLPWRNTADPYKIWVSEIMLQQTKVDTVIPYFQRFIEKYPTPGDLAYADEEEVLKTWEGLGYYSRARNLQTAVREVVEVYDGIVPDTPKELASLKGVGPYTKGAILSIAYHQPEPAVDGNVMRVFARILEEDTDISKPAAKKLFETYTRQMISHDDPSSFNQAIMDLGATICTPKTPMCMFCPVQKHCKAFQNGRAEELPVKSKGKKQKKVPYAALLISNKDNQYVIEKRPDSGLLANMWQFPMVPMGEINVDYIEGWFYNAYGIDIDLGKKTGTLKHVFSHLIWELDIYCAAANIQTANDHRLKVVDRSELELYPFPVPHQKMMQYISY